MGVRLLPPPHCPSLESHIIETERKACVSPRPIRYTVKIFAWALVGQQRLYFYRPLSSETGRNLILVCSLSTSLDKNEIHGYSGACRLSMETAVAELFDGSRCGTAAVAELFDGGRCGTTVAELFDTDERENYTKIVLQKRMWIQVGEEEIIR
jgi:hypothetical protein